MRTNYASRQTINSQQTDTGIVAVDNVMVKMDSTSGKMKDYVSQTEKYYPIRETVFDTGKTIIQKIDNEPYKVSENVVVVFK